MNRFKKLFLGICFIFSCIIAEAQTYQFKIAYEQFPPYEYFEKNQHKGMNIEIIREVCRRMRIEPIFLYIPFKRMIIEAKKGNVDAIISLFENEARKKFLVFPQEKITLANVVLVTEQNNKMRISTIGELKPYKIGIVLGVFYDEKLESNEYNLVVSHNRKGLILKQYKNETDVVLMDNMSAIYWLEKLKMKQKMKIMEYKFKPRPLYIAISKNSKNVNSKHMAKKISLTLKQMKAEGLIEKIEMKYKNTRY